MIDFSKIYILRDPVFDPPYRGDIELDQTDAFSEMGGEYKPTQPVKIKHRMGRSVPGDIVWSTTVGPVVVSQKVINIFKGENFQGWETYPVEVHNKAGEIVEGYWGLSIAGRCSSIDYSKCKKNFLICKIFNSGSSPVF